MKLRKLIKLSEAKYHLQFEPSEDTQRWMDGNDWSKLPDSKKEVVKRFETELNDIYNTMEFEYQEDVANLDPDDEWGEGVELDFHEVAMYAEESWKTINNAIGDKGLITTSFIDDLMDLMINTILDDED